MRTPAFAKKAISLKVAGEVTEEGDEELEGVGGQEAAPAMIAGAAAREERTAGRRLTNGFGHERLLV